jgi:hypothetical protein
VSPVSTPGETRWTIPTRVSGAVRSAAIPTNGIETLFSIRGQKRHPKDPEKDLRQKPSRRPTPEVCTDTTDAAIAVSGVSTLGRGAYSARKIKRIYIKWKTEDALMSEPKIHIMALTSPLHMLITTDVKSICTLYVLPVKRVCSRGRKTYAEGVKSDFTG